MSTERPKQLFVAISVIVEKIYDCFMRKIPPKDETDINPKDDV